MARPPLPLTIELSVLERDPPVGWIRTDGRRSPFAGWLELIGLVEAVVSGEPEDSPPAHDDGIVGRTRPPATTDAC